MGRSGAAPRAGGERGTYRKSEESRRQVLDAAIATLATRGAANASIQDIADAAGLSKGAVHYHFASKDELLERVLERCCERAEARVLAAFDEPATPMERVRRALVEMWTMRRDGAPEFRVLMELQVMARNNAPLGAAFAAALGRARQQMIDHGLLRLVELGLRPKIAIEAVPRLILATLDGLALHHALDPVTPEEEQELLRAIGLTASALFEL